MEPPPADFHDAGRMRARSVYGLYSTISLGVGGTSMPAFENLSEDERWALAFYVASLRAGEQSIASGAAQWQSGKGHDVFTGLREVTALTANEAVERGGPGMADVLAYLVAQPDVMASVKGSPIATTRTVMAESLAAYAHGDRDAAQRLAVSAYLEGFELVETSLDTLNPKLRVEVENAMIALRTQMRDGASADTVRTQMQAIDGLLDRVEELLGEQELSPSAAALSSFIILLREGLEAILVLAAVFAFLVKADRRDALRWVHAGWIVALALGFFTWFAASYLIEISGAGRELTEGITALIAAAVLLYVGFWLHSKAYAQAWQRYVRERLHGALTRGTLWALATVSFLAVYREVFEVVLFYQALWTQAGAGGGVAVIGGFLAAVVALAIISWLVFRYGVRLPLGPFFAASSILMALLAVIFVGKGIAALQEAGRLTIDAVAFPRIPTLGIYPTSQSLSAQAVVLVLVLVGFGWGYLSARRAMNAVAGKSS
jgi:high-affinity iron transporter